MKKGSELFNLRIMAHLAVVFVLGLLMFGYFRGQQEAALTTADPSSDNLIFTMTDPVGDDFGPGNYIYPQHLSFEPHKDLLDLLAFRVIHKGEVAWYELDFGLIKNPWQAPEGFFHQRVDIYIDSRDGYGRLLPANPGANVTFAREYPWDMWIRIAPWGGSKAYFLEKDDKLIERRGVEVGVVGDRTIRVIVPQEVLPLPKPTWRYYVLVGGYDGFGPDGYRVVTARGGDWIFGGGTDNNLDPNVIDLLAPKSGKHSQSIQLAYNVEEKQGAVLMPVGNVKESGPSPVAVSLLVLLAGAGAFGWQFARKNRGQE
ncbi:MAG: hypothetical protein H0Z38_07075 [Firmicutes bacterium]|nr:hypothetical protein [Bacillota bacterium]